jgi:Ca-activated chloride channel homolog
VIPLVALLQATQSAAPLVHSAADERFKLWGSYSFADPWFLLLVPVGLLALAWGRSRRGRERGRVPVLAPSATKRTIVQRLAWIPTALSAASIVLVSIALARPLRGSVETSTETEGVDIALVIDCSGSMRYEDLEEGKTRLQVVQAVVRDFAVRRMTDREGAADNVALIVFAAYPRLLCPFTLDVDAITGFLEGLQPVENRAEDGTGIGVGLAKAVAVLRETQAKTKVVVLLTDGENNIDVITPLAAAELAAEQKVKVYTVFAGRYVYTYDVFGNLRRTQREIDTSDLEAIAAKTGGRFFRARDRKELESIYAEIEQLERTKRVERRWSETYDLYLAWLVPALACHVLAWALGSTLLRRLP